MTKTLYDGRWQARRAQQLRMHPLCLMCEAEGRIALATIADHITPHRGDAVLFEGPLQSLCKTHHDSTKQAEERGHRRPLIGPDGYPVDGT